MLVELHILQNFAPSNLNRDDTGAPKDCEFGGYRRARISSQCIKRAMRKSGQFARFLGDSESVRTRRLIVEIAERIARAKPAPAATVKVVSDVFAEGGIERPSAGQGQEGERDNTRLLIYMDAAAIDQMVEEFQSRWDDLTKGSKESKSNAVAALGEILANAVTSPDVALFGRMIEIDPKKPFGKLQLGVDAASQVAHAISTNRMTAEFDFFTAVDELLEKGERGAGMMDTVGFNSSCYYRYANVDLRQLEANLHGKTEHIGQVLEAFLYASVAAIPSGKQNSFAAQNPPSFMFAVVRQAGMWSLANAFVNPIAPDRDGDLISKSVVALDDYWGHLTSIYGADGIHGAWCIDLSGTPLAALARTKVGSFRELVDNVLRAAYANDGHTT